MSCSPCHFATRVRNVIVEAQTLGLLSENSLLTGYSGKCVIALLQRLCDAFTDQNRCYLEIGVFQGMTLLHAAPHCKSEAYGIDNFAFFDPEGKNKSLVLSRMEQSGINNAILINQDYEDALEQLHQYLQGKKIGVYFVDGPHDYRSQLMCLQLVLPHLATDAVIVIDDCNYRHVRLATSDFLRTHPEFAMVYESYTQAHPHNLSGHASENAVNGWWNGIHVLIKTPGIRGSSLPQTTRSRVVYENEHLTQTVRFPLLMIQTSRLLIDLYKGQWYKFFKRSLWIRKQTKESNHEWVGKYDFMNTYSENLEERFHDVSKHDPLDNETHPHP
ncbi:MAG: hypothetical protein KatS3mg104_2797 [Phycisphaerae bacterium]|jgi:predicted O-methyltransferase YrrM|nr:MAG: hypothetical protein KatS3mg104_2797 [Phycisphaerae bacterium]